MTRQCSQPAEPEDDGRVTRRQASEVRQGVGEDPSKTRGEIRGRRRAKRWSSRDRRKGLRRTIAVNQRDPGPQCDRDQERVRRLSHGIVPTGLQVSRLRQGYGAAGYVTDVLLLDDGLASSVETDGLPLRAVAAEGERDGVGPCRIVWMDRANADSEKC